MIAYQKALVGENKSDNNRVLLPMSYGTADNVYTIHETYVYVYRKGEELKPTKSKKVKIINFIDNSKFSNTNKDLIINNYNSAKEAMRKVINNIQLLNVTYGKAAENVPGLDKINRILNEANKIDDELSNNNIGAFLNKIIEIENKIEKVNRQVNNGSIPEETWNAILSGRF